MVQRHSRWLFPYIILRSHRCIHRSSHLQNLWQRNTDGNRQTTTLGPDMQMLHDTHVIATHSRVHISNCCHDGDQSILQLRHQILLPFGFVGGDSVFILSYRRTSDNCNTSHFHNGVRCTLPIHYTCYGYKAQDAQILSTYTTQER